MCIPSGSGAKKQAAQQRADEEARKARIAAGMASIDQTFGKFDHNFYGGRAKEYIDYATPQFERQLRDTRDNLIFALSRTGNLRSSAAIDKNADLNYEADVARTGIANDGLNKANELRNQVENARGNVVAQLNATGDSSAASDAAIRNATNLSTPVGYSPLGNLFASFAQSAAAIGSNAGNGYSGFVGGGAQSFSPSKGSSTVVRG
jgi:hypothetical protein